MEQDALDARDHALAMQQIRSGVMPTLLDAELDDYLAAPTTLAFWRNKRGVTLEDLAAASGMSQSYLMQLEAGARTGNAAIYQRIAKHLGLRIDDIISENS
jgi:DNA-binding XRE family transcriptional regulator